MPMVFGWRPARRRRDRPVSPLWALFWIWPAFARDVTACFGLLLTPLFVLAAFIRALRRHSVSQAARPA